PPMNPNAGDARGLEFPLDWPGRVLARADAPAVPEAIRQALRAFGLAAEPVRANASSGGAYVSYSVSVIVPDRHTFEAMTYALSRIDGVRMVL
ncbi:MAG: DUF493 domain-containing protein, partial [Lentisphaeria bacterium]|nr:DUF493 domain-containing protein [Lentisphaeria bacterium]